MRKILLVLLLMPSLAYAQLGAIYQDTKPVDFVSQVYNTFNLAGAADQAVIELTWLDPRAIESVTLGFDRLSAVDADSSVFRIEYKLSPGRETGVGFTSDWAVNVAGTATKYVLFRSGAGDFGWTVTSDGNLAADGANALTAVRSLEFADGGFIDDSPQSLADPDAAVGNASGVRDFLAAVPVYGVRLYYDSEASAANNTGTFNFSLEVRFQ